MRFSELKKNCVSQFRGTISSRTLADRLELFRLRGFIERTPYNEVPPHVEYRLTEDGEKLAQAICAVLRTAVGKIDRSHSGSMADQSHSMKNPLVDEEWLHNLNASRKFMSKKLEKDPTLAKHITNVVMNVRG